MALVRATAMASGVDCLVAAFEEMPCRDLKAVCLVAGSVEMPCRDSQAVWLTVGPVGMAHRDLQAVEAAGDIERAWA